MCTELTDTEKAYLFHTKCEIVFIFSFWKKKEESAHFFSLSLQWQEPCLWILETSSPTPLWVWTIVCFHFVAHTNTHAQERSFTEESFSVYSRSLDADLCFQWLLSMSWLCVVVICLLPIDHFLFEASENLFRESGKKNCSKPSTTHFHRSHPIPHTLFSHTGAHERGRLQAPWLLWRWWVQHCQTISLITSAVCSQSFPILQLHTTKKFTECVCQCTFVHTICQGWGLLFSHPADYTPVCTTELGLLAQTVPQFAARNAKVCCVCVCYFFLKKISLCVCWFIM